LRTTVEVTSGLDMNDFHLRGAVPGSIDLGCTTG
jgi:hypothetical protein